MTWVGSDRWYVYEIVDPRGSVVFYIGKTSTPNARFAAHKSDPASAAFYRLKVIAEAGFKPEMNVIAEFGSEAGALDYEGYLISKTPGLVNRTGPYAAGRPPTKPFRRPVMGYSECEYVPLEPEDPMRARIDAVQHILGDTVSQSDIEHVFRAMEALAHEDAEYTYATDE